MRKVISLSFSDTDIQLLQAQMKATGGSNTSEYVKTILFPKHLSKIRTCIREGRALTKQLSLSASCLKKEELVIEVQGSLKTFVYLWDVHHTFIQDDGILYPLMSGVLFDGCSTSASEQSMFYSAMSMIPVNGVIKDDVWEKIVFCFKGAMKVDFDRIYWEYTIGKFKFTRLPSVQQDYGYETRLTARLD